MRPRRVSHVMPMTRVYVCVIMSVLCDCGDGFVYVRLSLGRKWLGLLFVSWSQRLRARRQPSPPQDNLRACPDIYDSNGTR